MDCHKMIKCGIFLIILIYSISKLMSFIKIKKRHRWIWLGGAALLLRVIYGFFPTLCEYSYSRSIFLGIRWLIDHTTALLPFATVNLLFFILLGWGGYAIYKNIKNRNSDRTWKRWWGNLALNFGNFTGGVIFFFLVLWGFNYARIPVEKQMGLKVRKLYAKELREEADYLVQACSLERSRIAGIDTNAIGVEQLPADLEQEMHRCLVEVLKEYNFPTVGWVRGRQIYPKGLLYGFNSSGVYIPFTGEGHIESALHPIQKPFTMAHEMSHGYGFGDEGTCNFLGYLACMRSENPMIRYSGLLNYWRYVFGELRFSDPGYYFDRRPLIDRGMHNDLEAIYAEMDKYFEFIPGLQAVAYEAYLQMQGVQEGLQSYDRMVLMVVAWRKKYQPEFRNSQLPAQYLVVLGEAQDAGYPQIGCTRDCCKAAWQNEGLRRMVVSLGLVDAENHKRWLFEATPDFKAQLQELHALADSTNPFMLPDGIFITHGHIGHYTGLMQLGREAMGSKEVPVYAMPRMIDFLSNNGPWAQLLKLYNIRLMPMAADSSFNLPGNKFQVTPILVPHRDEYTETVGFRIKGPKKSALFIPDIDKWEKWERRLVDELEKVDYAFLDATFYRNGEIPGRDMSEIPHPFVEETMELLKDLPETTRNKVYFIHFNHTNPLLRMGSKESRAVLKAGFRVARTGMVFSM